MKIIGLTGNIGSGKSTVAGIFRHLMIPVYHADEESKKLFERKTVRESITASFGDVYNDEGMIDRRKLADIVFSDPSKLSMLNAILHPLVREDFRKWTLQHPDAPYVIQEAAIIFESGFRNEFHKIIHVSCPADTAVERVTLRDRIPADLVKQRSRHQMDEKEKAGLSDFVILNDGFHMLVPQVLAVHSQILESGPESNNEVSSRAADA